MMHPKVVPCRGYPVDSLEVFLKNPGHVSHWSVQVRCGSSFTYDQLQVLRGELGASLGAGGFEDRFVSTGPGEVGRALVFQLPRIRLVYRHLRYLPPWGS
jgi:hypothetical protein